MPVDTRDKRAAVLGYALPITIYPNPDGALGQADRQQTAFLYPGILAGAPVVELTPDLTCPVELFYTNPEVMILYPEEIDLLFPDPVELNAASAAHDLDYPGRIIYLECP